LRFRHSGLCAGKSPENDIAVEQSENALKQYREARTRHYSAAIKKRSPGAEITKVVVKGDALEEHVLSHLKGAKADLSELEGDLYDELFDYIEAQKGEPSLQALTFPFEVPVSLSGFGVLTYKFRGKDHRALCPLGILPLSGETVAFIGGARKHAAVVEGYRAGMENGFSGLNAMESWLTNGSGHWFMRPSAWRSIPQQRQEKVLELLRSEEDNIGKMLDFSYPRRCPPLHNRHDQRSSRNGRGQDSRPGNG
jgi:hypothetical protein